MGTVDGEVVVHGQFEFLIEGPREVCGRVPKHPMMDNHQVRTCLDGQFEWDPSGIDGGGHATDGSIVLQLETIVGSGKVRDGGQVGHVVAKSGNLI